MAEFSIRQRVPFQCSLLSRPLSANNLPTTPSQLQSQAKEISALEITQVSLLVCIPSVHVHILRVVSRFLHARFREHWSPHLSDMLKGSRKGIMIMRHYGILSYIIIYYQHMYGALRCINSQTHRPPESRKTRRRHCFTQTWWRMVKKAISCWTKWRGMEGSRYPCNPIRFSWFFMFQCSRSYGLRFNLILVIVKDCWGLLRFIIKVCWICAHDLPPRNPSHTTTATTGWCRRLQIPEPSPWMGPELVVNLIFSFGESSLVNLVVSRNNQLWTPGVWRVFTSTSSGIWCLETRQQGPSAEWRRWWTYQK